VAKGKKQENPNKVAQRKAERVAFVQANPNLAPEVARQRFYVQTRAAELQAAGKDVDRAALREKFQSGGVTREGFYTPGDVARFNAARDNTSSLADSKNTPSVKPPVAPSATSTPTPTKPVTSSVKTPSTSYQAPQTTTALGQVAQPPSGTLAASKNNSGPNVRAGVGTRRVDTSMPSPNVPQIAGVTWRAPGDLPDAVITTPQRVPTPVKGKAPQLSGKGGQNLAARAAANARWDEEEFAADRLVNTGLVMGAEAVGGYFGGVPGAALAAGAAYNLTNRMTNWRTQGQFEGDTTLKGAATVTGVSAVAGGLTSGLIKVAPKVSQQWGRVQNWANDVRVAAPAPKALPQTTGKASGGPKGQVIETNVGRIAPRSMAVAGEQPFKPVAETVESKAANKVKDKVVNLVRRNKAQEAVQTVAPKSAPTILPAEPVAPKFTPEVTRESGLVIPATTNRTPAAERNPVFQKALDDVIGTKPATQEPVSLADTKAATTQAMADDGVKELTPRQIAARKGAETRAKNKAAALKLQEANVEVKAPTVPAAKLEPVPNVTPEPAPMSVVSGESPDRLAQMRNHPAFTSKLPETPPSLSVVKDDGVREINISFNDEPMPSAPLEKRPPRQRPNESDADYGRRLFSWQLDQEGEVFKAPAGFERSRGEFSYQEKAMNRIEGGMARTNRSRTTAFIDDAGMSPEGYPVQMPGESFMAFNRRSAEFSRSKGLNLPEEPDNSFLAQGTPEPISLDQSKSAVAEGDIPPKPSGMRPNAAYDPETGAWRNRTKDKKTGEFRWTEKRTTFANEEERKAAEVTRNRNKNQRRKDKRAAEALELKTKVEAIAASGGPDAEFGPFMFGGEPIGRSRVVLQPGEVPSWAQQNTSLTTPGLSEIDKALINNPPTPELEDYLRELGNAKKRTAGRRVTRGTREATSTDVQEYVRRFKGIRGAPDDQLLPGSTSVALTQGQVDLEREIEQILGTDSLIAIKNIALRGNTPPLTQNINARGLMSLSETKASSEPLISKLVVRPELPSASGNLREQAVKFFNAQGKIKGVNGADRQRAWNRVTQSDWFRQLVEKEPTFANYLIEQNSVLGTAFKGKLAGDVGLLPKPQLRNAGWPFSKNYTKQTMKAAETEFDVAFADDGLGAYSLKGEEKVFGPNAGDPRKGTTIAQRAEVADIEARSARFARLVERVKAEDQAAFGDIDAFNRGFEQGQVLDDMVDKGITSDYGITDERGFANIDYTQFRSGRRQLNQPFQAGVNEDTVLQAQTDALQIERKAVLADKKAGAITKEEAKAKFDDIEARLAAVREAVVNNPPPTQLSNPFQQEFGASLPKDYVRETPESFGRVWDPDTFKDEAGNTINGQWVTRQQAAEKAQSRATKQAARATKLELERENFYSKKWLDIAKQASLTRKAQQTKGQVVDKIFRDPSDPLKPLQTSWSREEAIRIRSVNERAAKIKAAGPQGKTAEQIRFELKNPLFGPEAPKGLTSQTRDERLSEMYREEMLAQKEVAEEMFGDYDMSEWERDIFED
jgi:hypothetical protein